MKEKLYQYAVLRHVPSATNKGDVNTVVVVPFGTLLAKDEDTAWMKATRQIPSTLDDFLNEIEILLRPF